MTLEFSRRDLEDLRTAKELLEHPGLAVKMTNLLGAPIERGFELLPGRWAEIVQKGARASLTKALEFAAITLADKPRARSYNALHKGIVATTGAAGGALGLAALPLELPVTTIVMLRSIAAVARSEGERIRLVETRLACLEVFALGGSSKADDATDTGYFAIRGALAQMISEAARHLSERGLAEQGAPALVRLIGAVASRFSLVLSDKLAAQALPFIGAAGGALVNTIFIDHFQDMARGHFIVRRLERIYGADLVRRQYESVSSEQ